MSKKKKKPYFHNNVDAFRAAPSECFDSLSFDEFMEWKTGGWELPSSVVCIIREQTKRGKIKEHVYKRSHAATDKIKKLMSEGKEFVFCNHSYVDHLVPNTKEDFDDPLA